MKKSAATGRHADFFIIFFMSIFHGPNSFISLDLFYKSWYYFVENNLYYKLFPNSSFTILFNLNRVQIFSSRYNDAE